MSEHRSFANAIIIALYGGVTEFYYPLRWWIVAALVLIILDARWGISAARKRGEKIRPQMTFKKSIGKVVDYICWVTLASVFGKMFDDSSWINFLNLEVANVALSEIALLIFVYVFEFLSCYSNYCEARNIDKWDLMSWFKKKTGLEIEKKNNKEEIDFTQNE